MASHCSSDALVRTSRTKSVVRDPWSCCIVRLFLLLWSDFESFVQPLHLLRTKKWIYFCIQMLPGFRKGIDFRNVPRLFPFVFRVNSLCRWRWECIIGRMVRTGKYRSTKEKTSHSAALTNTDLTWTGVGSNLWRSAESLTTNRLSPWYGICHDQKESENTFLSNAPRSPKELCKLEGPQASPVFSFC